MSTLEDLFHQEMLRIYHLANKELKYNPTRFLKLLSEMGGVRTAKVLIAKDGGTYGFEVLWKHNRLDLSVEAHVLKPKFAALFTEEERILCSNRLRSFGFDADKTVQE